MLRPHRPRHPRHANRHARADEREPRPENFAAKRPQPPVFQERNVRRPIDEIHHVEFGLVWLRQLKPVGVSDWDAWNSALHWPIRPSKARGQFFQRDARLQAGLTADFIDQLESFDESDD